jgi:hypothetical protein
MRYLHQMSVCEAKLVGGAVVGFLCVCVVGILLVGCKPVCVGVWVYVCGCLCVGVCLCWTFIAPFMALPCGCACVITPRMQSSSCWRPCTTVHGALSAVVPARAASPTSCATEVGARALGCTLCVHVFVPRDSLSPSRDVPVHTLTLARLRSATMCLRGSQGRRALHARYCCSAQDRVGKGK